MEPVTFTTRSTSHIPSQPQPVKPAPVQPVADEPPLVPAMLKCAVCLNIADEKTQLVVTTKCGHMFCQECLTASLEHSNKCPVCRKAVPKKGGWIRVFN
jgi:Ring finger domain